MKNIIYYIGFVVLIAACIKDKEETLRLQVINNLDNSVSIEFYDRGFPSETSNAQISGKGLLFEGSDTDRVVQVNQIFEADSIVLIFDNQTIEYHLLRENVPLGNSLLNGDSYTEVDGIFTYYIDNANLNSTIS